MRKMWYCGKTVKHYNEKEGMIEFQQKVSDVKKQIKHSNICHVALKRIRNYCGKKPKDIAEEEKKNTKHFLKM